MLTQHKNIDHAECINHKAIILANAIYLKCTSFCHVSTFNWDYVLWIGVMLRRITLFAGGGARRPVPRHIIAVARSQAPIKERHKTDTRDQAPEGDEPSWFKVHEEAKIVVHGTLLDLRTLT